MRTLGRLLLSLLILGGMGGLGWLVWKQLQEEDTASSARAGGTQAAPVETAKIEVGRLELKRTFSGALESPATFVVAPKIPGRVVELSVRIADTVQRDAVVARLDGAEYEQTVAQMTAELAVAQAKLVEAEKALEIAVRGMERIETLKERGVASDTQLDAAAAEQLAKEAGHEVAKADVTRAEALLEAAKIRRDYTEVRATWTGGEGERVVAERYVDEGDTVGANTPLLRIIELHPVLAVFHVTERDYTRLRVEQPVTLRTDAWPGETFEGRISRIAPVFRETTRQARIEVSVPNEDRRLKPGMFVRATVVLAREDEATIVPQEALTTRADHTGVFVLDDAGETVRWREVETGIRDGGRVQIVEPRDLAGRVVTLGQQLVEDGSSVVVRGLHGEEAGGAPVHE